MIQMKEDSLEIGAILYEKFGTIRFTLDGMIETELDLADCLANCTHRPLNHRGKWNKVEEYWEMMEDLERKREAVGLATKAWEHKDE